ncbi:MAG: bifunctional oligoribonuclease/PAP phosphatase NrnA [Flavobacteriales bacterium]|nr:bifunctional oligoribonuclease/PAP phosphatase NrnA [Flavobacteriales bacterium]
MLSTPSAPPEQVARLASELNRPRRIVLTTHYNPDGDAMGSSLGLAHVLRHAGHTVQVVLPNTPAGFLQWMPGFPAALAYDTAPESAVRSMAEAELLFCLDFNRPDRLGGLEESVRTAAFPVLIDHHQDPDPFARIMFSDVASCSTCQMVFDIVHALGLEDHITADAATCLYTGIMTDSGSFRFSSTAPHTLRVAARLMELGAVPDHIVSAVLDDNTVDRLRLIGFALSERLEVLPALGTAIITLSKADLDRFAFQPGDTEGLVNYGLSIRGIRLAAFFVERGEVIKVSLRSKGMLPVNRFLAEHFQGGGHINAAGGQSRSTLADAVARFRNALPAFIEAHPA